MVSNCSRFCGLVWVGRLTVACCCGLGLTAHWSIAGFSGYWVGASMPFGRSLQAMHRKPRAFVASTQVG